MSTWIYISILLVGMLFAILAGYEITKILYSYYKKKKIKEMRKEAAGVNKDVFAKNFCCDGLAKKILIYLIKVSYSMSFINEQTWISNKFIKTKKLSKKLYDLKLKSNMPNELSNLSLKEVQIRFSFCAVCLGMLVGVMFSYYLMIILAIVCFGIAWYLPVWALKQEKESRSQELEKNLPEMLEVVSLGLRSGLTFDRSLHIYCDHFNNELVNSFSICQKKWEGGLISRDDALRELSASYESTLFGRVTDNIIRSLRFGSSLVEGLEEAALESRNIYKAQQEEIVSKAPVKMMIPTGTLILPAMLILILGPILLELSSGF